ncbi:MAG: acetolactate decarboxylase [Solirubrobacterales bacterium]|jgi:acetolactate decarboxylase
MAFEERMVRSLHVGTMAAADLTGGHDHRTLFQASTIAALLEGRYEGDVTFGALALQGDTGLGTLNNLDGEMIALDGKFFRADVEGRITPIPPEALTPFAVVVEFDPDQRVEFPGRVEMADALATLDREAVGSGPVAALRIDGDFERVEARSVPRQEKPFRPLAEVVDGQNVFTLGPCKGSLVGFRFPDWSEGIEVAGYHLHFIDRDRRRGGHVLDFTMLSGTASIESSSDLNVELPPGVELGGEEAAAEVHAAIEKAERA